MWRHLVRSFTKAHHLQSWFDGAKSGDRFVYFRGHLSFSSYSLNGDPRAADIKQLQELALRLGCPRGTAVRIKETSLNQEMGLGLGELSQKRLEEGGFEYVLTKR
jgi:hypothetical protein